ncbi:hypothetical protein Clacol_004139 [Clathrus columnatus]|uniref:Uncharacterized protein n=1 Tax=Clathrus columnatus TaxID=1419009 RepID=A0AAV5A6K0_9AGAM|nr:hypothetical protein Clacol_004139 [Clathrus columnatus]
MLDLLDAYTGWPSEVAQLSLSKLSLLLYGFSDTIVILDAYKLRLLRVLAFWEVFPAVINSNGRVKMVVTDPGLKILAASVGSQLAFWSFPENESSALTVKVHSSLSLNEEITAIDCKSGNTFSGCVTSLAHE